LTCLFFFIFASVASRCFKSRSGVAHDMSVGSGRGRERSRAGMRRGRRGPSRGCGSAGAVELCLGDVSPRVDAKWDCSRERPDTSIRPDVRALIVDLLVCRSGR
jgi:hypothetical protein